MLLKYYNLFLANLPFIAHVCAIKFSPLGQHIIM